MQMVHLVIIEITNQYLQNPCNRCWLWQNTVWLVDLRPYFHLFTKSQYWQTMVLHNHHCEQLPSTCMIYESWNNFVLNFGGHQYFLLGYWYPCFGHLVTSTLGFKARVDPITCMLCHLCAMESWGSPLVHTCWLLGSQHGSQAIHIHIYTCVNKHWWGSRLGSIICDTASQSQTR